MRKDLGQTPTDVQHVLGEVGHSDVDTICTDADTVSSDYDTVASDYDTVSGDQDSSEGDTGDISTAIMALEHDPQVLPPIGGKCRWEDGIALNYTSVAVRGRLSTPLAVNQRNGQTTFGEMDGNRNADNPRSKNNDIGARHGTSAWESFPKNLAAASVQPARVANGGLPRISRVARAGMACYANA